MRYRVLGIVAAIPVWIAVAVLLAWTAAQVVARNFFNSILLSGTVPPGGHLSWDDAVAAWAGLAFISAIPLAAVFVVLEGLHRSGAPEGDDIRSPLAVWPGLPLALVVAACSVAAAAAWGLPVEVLLLAAQNTIAGHVFLGFVFSVAAAAGLTGGRPMRAVAAVAGPMVLVLAAGVLLDFSTFQLLTMLAAPCFALTIGFLILALATREKGAIWWAAGFLMVPIVAGACAPGYLTPIEALAVIAAVALPIGLIVNTSVRQTPVGWALVVGGAEIAALAAILMSAAIAAYVLTIMNVPQAIARLAENAPPLALLGGAVLLIVAASYVVTPALAFVLAFPLLAPVLIRHGINLGVLAALAVLGGAAATVLRSVRGRHAPPPLGASLATFPLSVAIGMAMLTLLILILTAIALLFLSLAP